MNKIILKFTNLDKAKSHLKSEGYRYSEAYNYKEDRCLLYKKRNNWMKLSSTFDYLTEDSMDMGTVWTLEQF